MNERIQELARQAGAKIFTELVRNGDHIDFVDYKAFDLEQFAESIIKECAHIAWLNSTYDNQAHSAIKQHFGVV